jgi:hypothetical protein
MRVGHDSWRVEWTRVSAQHRDAMRHCIRLVVLATALCAGSPTNGIGQVSTVRHGSPAATIGGSALGAFTGAVIGGGVFRRLCSERNRVCWPPMIAGLALGTAAGIYAGTTDTERIRGATIGFGAGALGGLVITSLLISTDAVKPKGEWQPIADLLTGTMIGAAVGTLVGGLLTTADDPDANYVAISALQLSF